MIAERAKAGPPPVEGLRARGWLERGDELRFTEWGASQRRALEDGTDALAVAPYAVLGAGRCAELRALASEVDEVVVSPGVPAGHGVFALRTTVPLVGEGELAC